MQQMKDLEKIRVSILEAASFLFDRFGYEKTAMEAIARRAHRAKASIYYHFTGKQDLLKGVLEAEFAHVSGQLEKIVQEYRDDPRMQVMSYLTKRMELIRETKVYRHYLVSPYTNPKDEIGSVVAELREAFDRKENDYFQTVCRGAIEAGILPGTIQPEAFGKMMETLVKGLEFQFFYSEDYESLRSTYETLVELLIFRGYDSTVRPAGPFPAKEPGREGKAACRNPVPRQAGKLRASRAGRKGGRV